MLKKGFYIVDSIKTIKFFHFFFYFLILTTEVVVKFC